MAAERAYQPLCHGQRDGCQALVPGTRCWAGDCPDTCRPDTCRPGMAPAPAGCREVSSRPAPRRGNRRCRGTAGPGWTVPRSAPWTLPAAARPPTAASAGTPAHQPLGGAAAALGRLSKSASVVVSRSRCSPHRRRCRADRRSRNPAGSCRPGTAAPAGGPCRCSWTAGNPAGVPVRARRWAGHRAGRCSGVPRGAAC